MPTPTYYGYANLDSTSKLPVGQLTMNYVESYSYSTPTVTLVGGAGNTVPVYTTNQGDAVYLGNNCFVSIYLTGDGGAEGAGTGQLNIALPQTASASQATSLFPVGYAINGPTEYEIYGQIAASGTTISLKYFGVLTTTSTFTGAEQNTVTRTIRLQFWYRL